MAEKNNWMISVESDINTLKKQINKIIEILELIQKT